MQFKKGAQVTARLHESTKHKLMKTGYNAAEAIEWFVNEYYSKNPRRRLEIKQDLEEIELNKLKKVECEVQLEIEHKEKLIDELIQEKGKYPEVKESPIEIMSIGPDPDSVLSDDLKEAIGRIKPVYDDKKGLIVGKNTTPDEALDVFISLNGEFVRNVYSEFGKGLKWREFKELLLSEVVS